MYKPYENKTTAWKKTKLNNQTFELPEYYDVVSTSINVFMKLGLELMVRLLLPLIIGYLTNQEKNPLWLLSKR